MAHAMLAYSDAQKRCFGSSLEPLSVGIPPDKFPENSNNLLNMKDLDLKSLNNATADELMEFDSDSFHLHLDSCVTGGLTGFKSDFIEGFYGEVAERSSDTTVGEATTTGEGIAA